MGDSPSYGEICSCFLNFFVHIRWNQLWCVIFVAQFSNQALKKVYILEISFLSSKLQKQVKPNCWLFCNDGMVFLVSPLNIIIKLRKKPKVITVWLVQISMLTFKIPVS